MDEDRLRWLARGRHSFEDRVNRRQVFSIGVGRLSGVIGPVAIISHEVLLANAGRKIKDHGSVNRIGPGWHRYAIDFGNEPVTVA